MNSELSRIHSLIDSDGTTRLADYTYLGRDRTVQVDFLQPGVKFTWLWQTGDNPTPPADPYTGWDRFGRAIDLRWIKNSSGAELERLQHGYDRASNRLYRKNLVAPDADKQDELYTYDGLSQLSVFQRGVLNTGRTAITGTPIAEEDFIFDPTGNWNEYVRKTSGTPTTQTRTHNKANELTAIDSSSSLVAEDAAGNMTKVPKPDSWSSAYDLKYDAWNRLVEVRDGSTVVATYAYDGLNRRTKKVMGSDTRHFYYTDKWQIIEERVNASTSADRQFVWGIRYTDDLVLRDKGTERLYVIQDYFQPTAVMDTTGAVLERYGYEAFGTSRVMEPDYTPLTDSAYEWETRYGAYRWDGETKMLQVRNRYLHTGLGRWVTRDPIGYEDGVNLFAYCSNAPVNYIDSLGLKLNRTIEIPLPPDWFTPKGMGEACLCICPRPNALTIDKAYDDGSSVITFRMKIDISLSGCIKAIGISWKTCYRPDGTGGDEFGVVPQCANKRSCSFDTYPKGYPTHLVGIRVRWLSCDSGFWAYHEAKSHLLCSRKFGGTLICE